MFIANKENVPYIAWWGAKLGVLILLLVVAPGKSLGQAFGPGSAPLKSSQPVAPDLRDVGIDQKLDAPVPLNLSFHDENGNEVRLQKYFDGKPVILSLVYYNCPTLCPVVLSGITESLKPMKLAIGKDYEVLTVSFDPKDTPQLAAEKKKMQLQQLGIAGAEQGWHFLTGNQDSIRQLTSAVGFRYKWDTASHQFNHVTGIMILTPLGRVSKYFYGVEYNPTDLRLGLIQASGNHIGTVVDQVLLFCCRYNPTTGKYDVLVTRLLSLAGAFAVLLLGSFLYVMFRFGRPGSRKAAASRAAQGSS
jgi:protein SCO1/2